MLIKNIRIIVSVDDPSERVDKADGRNDAKHQKQCFAHCRHTALPTLRPQNFLKYHYKYFLFFLKTKSKRFLYRNNLEKRDL